MKWTLAPSLLLVAVIGCSASVPPAVAVAACDIDTTSVLSRPPLSEVGAAFTPPAVGGSWAPRPVMYGGLSTLAEPVDGKLALHTVSGEVTFWTGVNLGSTTPGHSPGELAITAPGYRRWFADMGRMGVRMVRVYTIHPPEMYSELLAYNRAAPTAPLYLVQGVYLPDESYVRTGNLFDPASSGAFANEIRDASAAIHGDLRRSAAPGRASGTWTADVSPYVAAWIIGVEWDPQAILASDKLNASAPDFRGTYFSSTSDDTRSTPTERWIAGHMDALATAEAAKGRSVPIAFVNWPTTDPLRHPEEPLKSEDLVGVDANHVRAGAAWPGGTFASFHAYPYYPDFLRHQPAYQAFQLSGKPDPFAGYLTDLKRHFGTLPLLITETGVPSSLGSAHLGTNGRDQGNHSEQEALAMDASLVRVIHDVGLGGALLFAWTDEWFKYTWNTLPRHAVADGERRALWHDPLTNEQWFGLYASDPVPVGDRTVFESRSGIQRVVINHDASYLYVTTLLSAVPTSKVRLGFDIVPGGLPLPGGGAEGQDVAVVLEPNRHTGVACIRGDMNPLLLDGHRASDVPRPGGDGWSLQQMSINRSFDLNGRFLPAEYFPVGELREGRWDPLSAGYDSRSTWRVDGPTVYVRIPWSMLMMGDPSSRTAVVPADGKPRAVTVAQIGLLVDAGADGQARAAFSWEGWQRAEYRERLKVGVQPIVDAWAVLSRPVR